MLPQFNVDSGRGFVEDDDRRRVDQGLGDQEAAAHAARQGPGVAFGLIGKTHRGEDFVGSPGPFRDSVETGLEFQGFARGEKRVDVEFLRHHPDRLAGGARVPVDVVAPYFDRTGGLQHQSGENVDQGGFPGSVGTEQTEKGTAGNLEVDSVEGHRGLAAAPIRLAQATDDDGVAGKIGRSGGGHTAGWEGAGIVRHAADAMRRLNISRCHGYHRRAAEVNGFGG